MDLYRDGYCISTDTARLDRERIVLATANALYERFGLRPVDAERMMERRG